MRKLRQALSFILVSTCLMGSLPRAWAKSSEKHCGGMSRKALVNRIGSSLDQMAKSYEACGSSQGCMNTPLIKDAITAAGAIVGFMTGILIAKKNTKELIVSGITAGVGIANVIINDKKPNNADAAEMNEAINEIKEFISNPNSPIDGLKEYCERLSQPISLDDLASELIQSGRPFIVHINCEPDEAGYEKMGSIACGRDYRVVYKSDSDEWTSQGYARDEKRNVTNTFKKCGKPTNKQICIWGRGYTFDRKVRVIDPDYGKIASLRFE